MGNYASSASMAVMPHQYDILDTGNTYVTYPQCMDMGVLAQKRKVMLAGRKGEGRTCFTVLAMRPALEGHLAEVPAYLSQSNN